MPKNKGKVRHCRGGGHNGAGLHTDALDENRVVRTGVVERTRTTTRSESSLSRKRVRVCRGQNEDGDRQYTVADERAQNMLRS
jgi:hypothetical protein